MTSPSTALVVVGQRLLALIIVVQVLCLTALAAQIIDDSKWNTESLQQSGGWNMVRPDQIESISDEQVEAIRQFGLQRFFNNSISWTNTTDAWTELSFRESHIIVYGLKGPNAGNFTVTMDGRLLEGVQQTWAPEFQPNATIFQADALEPESLHKLRMTNTGGFLYFDYAVASNDTMSPSSSSLIIASTQSMRATSSPQPTNNQDVALLSIDAPYHFDWNWRAYFVLGWVAGMIAIMTVYSLLRIRRDRLARQSYHESSFLKSDKRNPIARNVQRLKELRKSAISRPQPHRDNLSPDPTPRMSLRENAGPPGVMSRSRSWSVDSVTGVPKTKQLTLAEALQSSSPTTQHPWETQSPIPPRPIF